MIVKAVGDVISLSGSLTHNQWLTLKAAANLLLKRNPEGILIDCGSLLKCTPDGARTFKDAVAHIESHQARIILVNLPKDILETLQSVPGVRSCIATARSVDEARASLKLASMGREPEEEKDRAVIMLPLLGGVDVRATIHHAGTVTRDRHGKLYLVYILEVPRSLALNAPLAEQEQVAKETLDCAEALAMAEGLSPSKFLRRHRDLGQGLIEAAQQLQVDVMVLGLSTESAGHQAALIETLIKRAPCELIIDRTPPPQDGSVKARETQRLP